MFLFVYSLLLLSADVLTEECVTPNNEQAQCVSLYRCPLLLQALATQTQTAIDFVTRSTCGKQNDSIPFVCCGTNAEFHVNLTQSITESTVTRRPLSDRRFCGYQHSDDYYHSQDVAALDEFPWVAVLKYAVDEDLNDDIDDNFVEFGCAGVVINSRYVLSAAHCLKLRTSSVVGVRLGEHNINSTDDCFQNPEFKSCSDPVEDFEIEEEIKHPNYNRKTGVNDIALVRLNRTITFSDYIRPICLPIPGTRFADFGDTLVTTGFGKISSNGKYVDVKKKILNRLITNGECERAFSEIKKRRRHINENVKCVREFVTSRAHICEGDSGGPLMFANRKQWHVEGILTWGTDTCRGDYPNVYTKVENYLDWIEETIRP